MSEQTSNADDLNESGNGIPADAEQAVDDPLLPGKPAEGADNASTIQMVEEFFSGKRDSFVGEIPPQLGNYLLGEPIGRGAMGVVFRATQLGLTRPVAIKVLRRDALWIEERFEREAKLASRLYHPNIVPVFDYGETENNILFLAMPFIQGQSLDRLRSLPARNAKEKWRRLATLGRDCADALNYAHSSGVIHRDIKPANLILGDDDNIWITDFGLAKLDYDDNKLSRAGEVIGTPFYMAPEQIRGECDERSDIYSLGLTLYELAVGDRAWGDDDERFARLPSPRSRNKSIPKPLSDIISRACAICPNERYQTAEELKVVLNRYLVREKVADRRVRPRKELWSPSKRFSRKLVWVTALAAMVLGICGFSFRSDSGIRMPDVTLHFSDSSESQVVSAPVAEPVPEATAPEPEPVRPVIDQMAQLADEQAAASNFRSGLPVIVRRIMASTDDAEEAVDGEMKVTSTDLEMVWREAGPQIIGLRFAEIDLPQGAFVQNAYIQFVGDECDIGETKLKIQLIDDPDPPTFVKEQFNISSRPLKPDYVLWSPPGWKRNKCCEDQRTPDLSGMLQAHVHRENWVPGSAIGFVISGEGLRCASTYDRSAPLAPMLCIEYTTFDILKLEGIHWPQMLSDIIPAG
ncbi:MAG: serine/threonine-protein kinase [Planctomycetota bacterium]